MNTPAARPTTPSSPGGDAAAERRSGLLYAIAAYTLWGLLPLYFVLLTPAGAIEVVAVRILFSLAFCVLLIAVTRGWRRMAALLTDRRIVWTMLIAAILILINWQTYVYATLSEHIVEASLGYFINPIVTIFLGVLFLGERLRPLQWAAVAISIGAVVVLAVGYGSLPWLSLVLAFSFGLYGLIKKRVGGRVDALSGLTLETMWLIPIAIAQLIIVGVTTGITFGNAGLGHAVLLAFAGVVTAVPLLLFASGSRRLPLVYMGFIQFFAPVLQFVIGVAVFHEPMPLERLAGFALVWLALALIIADSVRVGRRSRRGAIRE